METVMGRHAVLFEGDEGGEHVSVGCAVTRDGSLLAMRESAGELSRFCFGESPHREEIEVERAGVDRLLSTLGIEEVGALPAALRMRFTGVDCWHRVLDLLHAAGAPYVVAEDGPDSARPIRAVYCPA